MDTSKNDVIGLFCTVVIYSLSQVQLFATLRLYCSPPDFSVHGISKARILECVAYLLQGIFPTQGSSPNLLHRKQILYPLSQRGGSIGLDY